MQWSPRVPGRICSLWNHLETSCLPQVCSVCRIVGNSGYWAQPSYTAWLLSCSTHTHLLIGSFYSWEQNHNQSVPSSTGTTNKTSKTMIHCSCTSSSKKKHLCHLWSFFIEPSSSDSSWSTLAINYQHFDHGLQEFCSSLNSGFWLAFKPAKNDRWHLQTSQNVTPFDTPVKGRMYCILVWSSSIRMSVNILVPHL